MLDAIKDFYSTLVEFFVWLIIMCLTGTCLIGAYVLVGLFMVGAFALPLLPLIVGIWLISLLF